MGRTSFFNMGDRTQRDFMHEASCRVRPEPSWPWSRYWLHACIEQLCHSAGLLLQGTARGQRIPYFSALKTGRNKGVLGSGSDFDSGNSNFELAKEVLSIGTTESAGQAPGLVKPHGPGHTRNYHSCGITIDYASSSHTGTFQNRGVFNVHDGVADSLSLHPH